MFRGIFAILFIIMITLRNFFVKHSTGGKILFFFILTQIVYGLILLVSIPEVLQYSKGMKILDLMPAGYSAEYVEQLFIALGETGRGVYLWQQIPLDMIYPGLFALTYTTLLVFLFKKTFSPANKIQKVALLPIFAGFFDYLENIGIIVMLNIYPNFHAWLANLTNIFSVAKSFFTTITFILIFVGLGALLKMKIVRNTVKTESENS